MLRERLETLLSDLNPRKSITFLTGAGISAESGIPTFRGSDGYWTVGSKVYQPQEMATRAFFQKEPWEIWRWYLYRRGVCSQAKPNEAHHALVRMEQAKPAVFHLITQNIDGLHTLAGNSDRHLYEVHGNGHQMRCAARCSLERYPIPAGVLDKPDDKTPLTDEERALLVCPRCGHHTRPHVLWFDEYYEEPLYRSDTAMAAAASASVLITVGTSGATSLPVNAVIAAERRGAILIDVNPEPNPFQQFAEDHGGLWLPGSSSQWIPTLVEILSR